LARQKTPELRSNLIEAAEKVLWQKGYAKATVSDIVKEAGVAQGTFYLYFKSKEDMLDAVAEYILSDMVNLVIKIGESPGKSALEKVREIIRVWMEIGTTPGPLIDELHGDMYAPLHDRLARKAMEQMLPAMTGIIRQGVAEGSMDVKYPEVTAVNWAMGRFDPNDVIPGIVDMTNAQMVDAYTDYLTRVLGLKDAGIFDDIIARGRPPR
jgi:AcrR family transcriptional regulator